MSMNHLVGGRAFTLFGRTRKGGSVGIGRWTAFSLETRPVAARIFRIPHGDVTIIGRCGGRGKEGEGKRKRKRRKTGWDAGEERTRGMRGQALVGDVQVSSSRKVSSRAKISHFDVSQFYLILQRVGGSIAGDFSLISSWEIIHRMLVISFKLLRLFTGMGYSMENLNIRMSRIC